MKAKSRLKLPSSRSTAQSRTLQTSSGYMISKLGAAEFRRRGEDLKKKRCLPYQNITYTVYRAVKLQKIIWLSGANPIFGEKTGGGFCPT